MRKFVRYIKVGSCAAIVGVAVSALSSVAAADVLYTSDGSRLVGKIEQISNGKVIFISKIVGRLEIDMTNVTGFSTDTKINVQFDSGDRLVGTVEMASEDAEPVMHTALGDLPLARENITSLWPVGAESPEILAIRAEAEAVRVAMIPQWSFTLEAGGSATEGNTDTMNARGRLDVRRKTSSDLLHLYLAAKYSEQNDSRTENEYRGGVWYESATSDRAFWYTRVELEFDEFENLDLRSTAAAGGGRYWLKSDLRELKTSLGIGYRHESFNNGLTRNDATIDLGLAVRLEVAPWLRFTHETKYSPDFEDFDNYRVDADTALLFPMIKDAWALKVGMRNEYNSRPQRRIDRLDNTFYANIVLELK